MLLMILNIEEPCITQKFNLFMWYIVLWHFRTGDIFIVILLAYCVLLYTRRFYGKHFLMTPEDFTVLNKHNLLKIRWHWIVLVEVLNIKSMKISCKIHRNRLLQMSSVHHWTGSFSEPDFKEYYYYLSIYINRIFFEQFFHNTMSKYEYVYFKCSYLPNF